MNITERFLKYVGYGTNSDEKSETCPSTPNQLVLGAAIAEELKALGLTDVEQDADGYVYGYLPGEGEALGLIAHMDTSPAVSGDHIKPRIVTYPGGVLELGTSSLSPTDYPFLEEYIGQELIVTDGTTLLGADDKAGVAEIVTLCEYLLAHPEVKHRPIAVCFTPDEEIGRGTDRFRMDRFPAKEAYTVDGGKPGKVSLEKPSEIEYLLTLPASVIEEADDAASLFHMMNGNTFTCGVLHLKDAGQLDAAAGEVKTYVMNTQWMCGFPDKLVVASLDGYLISVFGAEDLVDTFRDKLQTAYPGTQIVSDDPIA